MNNYLFSFLKYSGDDKVFVCDLNQDVGIGDLIYSDGDFFVNLGKDVSWVDKKMSEIKINKFEILQKGLLSQQTILLIHFLVHQYYTTYKKVMNLFLDEDMDGLMKYKIDKKKKPQYFEANFDYENSVLQFADKKISGQQLIIFPDLFGLKNSVGGDITMLYGSSTQSSKNKVFRKIKSGELGTLVCTYSQIFQDWQNLKKIIIIDSHKRYYKSQQDPRYRTPTILKKMAEIYGAKLIEYGYCL